MDVNAIDEEAIFKVAVEIAGQDTRDEYLRQICGNDSALFERVAFLLREHDTSPSFLESPPAGVAFSATSPAVTERVGDQIGPYKLREQIDEGGMGVVYVAEQSEPIRRKVALKIIKPGMATKDVVARFEAERHALALMDHPHIARIIDGGATQGGQPFFVMELVQGLPINEYCDTHQLDTDQRLQLFAKVCRAVQHAHQKGIIHRDLKPSNVLVARIDGEAVPKIIDFGVAKAVNHKLTEQTVYTQFSQMIGTPMYMSPEQTELGVIDIDTRSDVYSLGAMLYELLTSRTPFDSDTLKSAGFDEMRRIIREQEPPRPSVMVSTLGAAVMSTVAERRRQDPRKLRDSLAGELDWIVMKALEKDRNRRYESASALATDIQRYVDNDPVLACPPSLAYRVKKYTLRHRGLLAIAALLIGILTTSTIVSLWFGIEAQSAAQDAIAARSEANEQRLAAIAARETADKRLVQSRHDFNRALASLDTIVHTVSRTEFASAPEANEIRNQVFEKALAFYQEIIEGHENDSYARLQEAEAHCRIGMIQKMIGDEASALQEADRAMASLDELIDADLDERDYDSVLFRALAIRVQSPLRTRAERLADAEHALARGKKWVERGVPEAIAGHQWWMWLVAELQPEGSSRAQQLKDEIVEFSEKFEVPLWWEFLYDRAERARASGDDVLAESSYRQAIAWLEMASQSGKQEAITKRRRAVELKHRLAQLFEEKGRIEDAEQMFQDAFEEALETDRHYGSLPYIHEAVEIEALMFAEFLLRDKRPEEAADVLDLALKRAPEAVRAQRLNAWILSKLVTNLRSTCGDQSPSD